VKLVAPVPPDQLTVADVCPIGDAVKPVGAVGAASVVVTVKGEELVDPPEFVAITITAYAVLATNPVNTTEGELELLLSVVGVLETPPSVYVYDVAPEPPFQPSVKEVAVIEDATNEVAA
jgi:hypothetical protein